MGFQQSFKALSDPVRREILSLLRRGPMAAATIIPTVLSWRWYRAEQQ